MFLQLLDRLSNYPEFIPQDANFMRFFLEKIPMHYRKRFTVGYAQPQLLWDVRKVRSAFDALTREGVLETNIEILCPQCSATIQTIHDITKFPKKIWCSECEEFVKPDLSEDVWISFGFRDEFLTVGQDPYEHHTMPNNSTGIDDVNSFFRTNPTFQNHKYYHLDADKFSEMYSKVKSAASNNEKKHTLEDMAEYLMSTVQGFVPVGRDSRATTGEIDRTLRNDADYHAIFRGWGPFIQIECKNTAAAIGTDELGDFRSLMEDVKSKTGVYFTREGVTGNTNRDGWRRILNLFQQNEILIIVLDDSHFDRVQNGESFVEILFEEYMKVHMQLAKDSNFPAGVRVE